MKIVKILVSLIVLTISTTAVFAGDIGTIVVPSNHRAYSAGEVFYRGTSIYFPGEVTVISIKESAKGDSVKLSISSYLVYAKEPGTQEKAMIKNSYHKNTEELLRGESILVSLTGLLGTEPSYFNIIHLRITFDGISRDGEYGAILKTKILKAERHPIEKGRR
jgi:hypothetical protein